MNKTTEIIKNLDPPKILSDLPANVTVLNTEEISIECKALGNPYPKISWQIPSGDIVFGAVLHISAKSKTNSSGNFICQAENSVGQDTKAVYVDIIGELLSKHASTNIYLFSSLIKSN